MSHPILDSITALGGKGKPVIKPKAASTPAPSVPSASSAVPESPEPATLTAPPLSDTTAADSQPPRHCIAGQLADQAELATTAAELLDRIEEKLFGEKEEVTVQAAEPDAAVSSKLRCLTYNGRIHVTRLQQILEAL
jgi:hypothetical protein